MKRIYLLGFMGVGKTYFGEQLSHRLSFKYIDLDNLIVEKEDSTITDIFLNDGEKYFRNKETYYLQSIAFENNYVVALGGGTPCFNNNTSYLLTSGFCIYLKASSGFLFHRLKESYQSRPLLSTISIDNLENTIEKKLDERKSYYQQAHITLDAETLTIDELIKSCADYLRS